MYAVPEEMRRLSIHAEADRADVVLSAAVPLESLIPPIVDTLNVRPGQIAVRWRLSDMSGALLDASKTLRELGIPDGTSLALTSSSMDFVPPRSDDAAEVVSATVAAVERRWDRRAAQLVGVLVASCLSAVSAAILLRTALDADAGHRAGCVGVAAAVSLGALLAAATAYRVAGQQGAGLALGLIATAFAGLAGLFAVPGGPDSSNALFAAAAAATATAIIYVTGCHTTLFVALTCFAMTCSAAAGVCALTTAPLPVIGAGLAATSLASVEASPPASVLLARLSPEAPASSSDQLPARTIRAHTYVTSFVAAFSASASLGAIAALFGSSPPRIAFAAAVGGLLLLRSRTYQDLGRSVPPVMCGTVTLGAVLVAAANAYPDHTLFVAGLSMVLGLIALYLGFSDRATATSVAVKRNVERVEYLAFATVVPLTFWLCGLFGAARGVNLS